MTTIIKMERTNVIEGEAWAITNKDSPDHHFDLVVSVDELPSKVRKALEGRSKVFFEASPAPEKPFPHIIKRQAPWQEW